MARPRRLRKIVAPPRFKGYRPHGHQGVAGKPVELLYEEYEALKLADYDGLDHQAASQLMGVSRPTFARIYQSVRKKLALALVETRPLVAVYGNAWMDKSWFVCSTCKARYSVPEGVDGSRCALCGSSAVELIEP
jgi:predicted DNA-binding protein (UPF0251 family)